MSTVASTAPIARAVPEKAPARINMTTISMIVLLAEPRQNISIRCVIFLPLDDRMATAEAIRKATETGIFVKSPVKI